MYIYLFSQCTYVHSSQSVYSSRIDKTATPNFEGTLTNKKI